MFNHRLLLLTETFPPEIGGIQQYLSSLFSALPSDTSIVIAPEHPHAVPWDTQQPYRIVRTAMRGLAYPRWRPALTTLRRVVAEFQPEVIVCGKALFEGRAVLALQTEQRRSSPTPYSLHPTPYVVMTYAMELQTWMSHWKTRRDLLRVLQNAARIVVINAQAKRLLIDRGIPEQRMVKIYPGVAAAFFEEVAHVDDFRRQHGLPGKRVIVSVARLVPRKGIDTVLRVLPDVRTAIPNLVYAVVGDGPERLRLQRLAEELGIADSVRFLGAVPPDDLRRALRAADCFVLTPREIGGEVEGFGIVYLEAAAAGLTSIGSRSGGVPEAVLDHETGILVAPDNPQETAAAIRRLLQDDALRARLASHAHARAQQEFSWPRRALLFRGMIEAIVQEQAKGHGA